VLESDGGISEKKYSVCLRPEANEAKRLRGEGASKDSSESSQLLRELLVSFKCGAKRATLQPVCHIKRSVYY
jgi:hypothetical protein